MKKTLLLSLGTIALASGTLLASCNSIDPNAVIVDLSKQVAKKTAITVWMDDSTGNYFNELKAGFAKVDKNIILKTQKVGNIESIEQLKLKGPSGNGADVIQFPHDKLSTVVSQDLALALEGSIIDYARERTSETAFNLTQFNDPATGHKQYYAIPKETESPGFYYNKALIKKEDIPKTFEDIVKQYATYNSSHSGQKYFSNADNWTNVYMAQSFLSAYGFVPFGQNRDDAENIGYKTDAYKQGLEYLRSLKTSFGISDDAKGDGADLFNKGLSPIIYSGPWNHNVFKKANINYGRVVLPTLNGQKMKPFMGAQMVGIYKHTKHQEEAKKFLTYLLSDEAAKINWEVNEKVSALKPELLAKVEGLAENEVVQAMSEDMLTAIPMPAIKEIDYFWGPSETALTQLFNSTTQVEEIAKEAEENYQKQRKQK